MPAIVDELLGQHDTGIRASIQQPVRQSFEVVWHIITNAKKGQGGKALPQEETPRASNPNLPVK